MEWGHSETNKRVTQRETHLVGLACRSVRHDGIAAAGIDALDKHANPGLNSAVPREGFLYTQTFLTRYLEPASARP